MSLRNRLRDGNSPEPLLWGFRPPPALPCFLPEPVSKKCDAYYYAVLCVGFYHRWSRWLGLDHCPLLAEMLVNVMVVSRTGTGCGKCPPSRLCAGRLCAGTEDRQQQAAACTAALLRDGCGTKGCW